MSLDLSDDEWTKRANADIFDDFDINDEVMAEIGTIANSKAIRDSVRKFVKLE